MENGNQFTSNWKDDILMVKDGLKRIEKSKTTKNYLSESID
jgi:hypothetical protein